MELKFTINKSYLYEIAKDRIAKQEKLKELDTVIQEHAKDRTGLFMALKGLNFSLEEIGKSVTPSVSRQRVQQIVGSTPRAKRRKFEIENFDDIVRTIWGRAAGNPSYWSTRGRLSRKPVIKDLIELTGCPKGDAGILAHEVNIHKAAIFLTVGMGVPLADHAKWITGQMKSGESQTDIWKKVNSTLPNIELSHMAWCRYSAKVLQSAANNS